jgi:hypothetical protein
VFENVFQEVLVMTLQFAQRAIEAIANIDLQMPDRVPPRLGWDKERILIAAVERFGHVPRRGRAFEDSRSASRAADRRDHCIA